MILETLKHLMRGQKKVRRPALDLPKLEAPVEAARTKLEAARAEHAKVIESAKSQAIELEAAAAAFEADGGNSNADRLVDARRAAKRHAMFTDRTQRIVDRATAELKEAEAVRDRTVLETLNLISGSAWQHIQAEWERSGKPALTAFHDFLREVDTILAEAETAARESGRIRGDGNVWMTIRGLDGLGRGVLLDLMQRELGFPAMERITRTVRF